VENTQSILRNAGGKDQLVADFTALCEATTREGQAKYALRPTLETLAKFLCVQASSPNKDMALFELSHLVCGVAAIWGKTRITEFFLSPLKATPAFYKQVLTDSHKDVAPSPTGLVLRYGDKQFEIRFTRMPFLVALYEFLCSMDGFAYFQSFNDLFEKLAEGPVCEKNIRDCSNALASGLRKYRIAYLSSAQADGKFSQVYKFLQERSTEQNMIILQDDCVFDFWHLHNQGKDYKGYRTVFDLFCDFARAFEESRLANAAARALPLGLNRDAGEVDVADDLVCENTMIQWTSPFDLLDEVENSDIRFFKKKTERGPIEHLMMYGPDALRLPLAFLRYEIFGQVQSGITNDLQVGRPKTSLEKRISCEDVQTYDARLQECRAILSHIKDLQAASLHVLANNEVDDPVTFPVEVRQQGAQAFAKIKRKGFDEDAFKQRATFERAAHALVAMEHQLVRYMDALENKKAPDMFLQDRDKFKTQFQLLYQEVLS